MKQHETLYKLCKSKLNESDNTKYIKYHNDCVLKIAKLKHMIKLKSELTNDDEIIIDKKNIGLKVNEERLKTYYIDNIKELKDYISKIKSYVSNDYDITNAFTPAFIDFFCRKFGISHYAYDINKLVL